MRNNRLLNLMAKNAKRGEFRAEGNTIFIYDIIVGSDAEAEWFGGVSPEAFAKTLAGMSGDVSLRINSPGGDVFGARAIVAAMANYPGQITAYVDGYAASSASIIAASAPKVVMAEGAFLMIHKAWSVVMGNSDEMLAMADLLEKIDGSLAQTYADRAGKPVEDFAAMMAVETWFDADSAIEAGLADEKYQPAKKKSASAQWDMSAFGNPPAAPAAQADPVDEIGPRVRAHQARMLALTSA